MLRILAVLILLLAGGAAAAADRVTLSNGDRLTGEVVELAEGKLLVRSELLGALEMPWEAVEALASDVAVYVAVADGSVHRGRIELEGDALTLHTAETTLHFHRDALRALYSDERRRALEAARQEEEAARGTFFLFRHWAGAVDSGLNAARGNNHTNVVNLAADAARTTDRDRLSLYLASIYSRSRAANVHLTAANTIRSGLRYDRLVGQRLFAFGFTDFEFDQRQQLDLRSVFGGGLGFQLRRSERTTLDLFAGGSLNREKFSPLAAPAFVRRSGEALGGQELIFRLSPRVHFNQRLVVFPNLTDLGEYRLNLDAGATARLNAWLGWRFNVSNRYATNPTGGARKNDLLLTTGLRLSFGTPRELPARTRAPDMVPRR